MPDILKSVELCTLPQAEIEFSFSPRKLSGSMLTCNISSEGVVSRKTWYLHVGNSRGTIDSVFALIRAADTSFLHLCQMNIASFYSLLNILFSEKKGNSWQNHYSGLISND